MGGVAKGNLLAPDGRTLLSRLVALTTAALPGARVVLVGDSEAYDALAMPAIPDTPPGIGPLGGLAALLAFAERAGSADAIALSCDLPYLGVNLIERLAREFPGALALAPRADGRWSPLTARYAVSALTAVANAIARRAHSLQRVFDELGARAHELPLTDEERLELRDWYRPEDIVR